MFVYGFQVKPVETISGVVENINQDSKSVVVNKAQILISSQTKIVDEKGNTLKMEDLNPSLSVAIEGFRNPNGFAATKIIVKTPKKRPWAISRAKERKKDKRMDVSSYRLASKEPEYE